MRTRTGSARCCTRRCTPPGDPGHDPRVEQAPAGRPAVATRQNLGRARRDHGRPAPRGPERHGHPRPEPQRRGLSSYLTLPRRAHLVIYSLNLVLLRAYLGDEEYVLEGARWRRSRQESGPTPAAPGTASPTSGAPGSRWRASARWRRRLLPPAAMSASRSFQPGRNWPRGRVHRSPTSTLRRGTRRPGDRRSGRPGYRPFARMPESVFDAFWREFGDAVPDLGTVATVLRLKMYAMDGDEIVPPAEETQDGALRLSLDLYIDGAGVAFDFADVVARMTIRPASGGGSRLTPMSFRAWATIPIRGGGRRRCAGQAVIRLAAGPPGIEQWKCVGGLRAQSRGGPGATGSGTRA